MTAVSPAYAIARLNTFNQAKLAGATDQLDEFQRLHASQPGYAGSITIDLGHGRRLTVNVWDGEQHATLALSNLRAEVGRVIGPLLSAPSQFIGSGPLTGAIEVGRRRARIAA